MHLISTFVILSSLIALFGEYCQSICLDLIKTRKLTVVLIDPVMQE